MTHPELADCKDRLVVDQNRHRHGLSCNGITSQEIFTRECKILTRRAHEPVRLHQDEALSVTVSALELLFTQRRQECIEKAHQTEEAAICVRKVRLQD